MENFDKIALSSTVKEIEANLFFHFWQKFQKFKMAAIFGEKKIKELEANLWFSIFGQNSKIQNGRHFGGEEIFFENCQK